jgi:hypothetical protein
MRSKVKFGVRFAEKLNLIFCSGQDGDPEYLGDLDRQVMQRNRLKQVKNFVI